VSWLQEDGQLEVQHLTHLGFLPLLLPLAVTLLFTGSLPKTENVPPYKEDDQQQHQESHDAAERVDRTAVASVSETAQQQDDEDDDE
jgi:hypothetical protein